MKSYGAYRRRPPPTPGAVGAGPPAAASAHVKAGECHCHRVTRCSDARLVAEVVDVGPAPRPPPPSSSRIDRDELQLLLLIDLGFSLSTDSSAKKKYKNRDFVSDLGDGFVAPPLLTPHATPRPRDGFRRRRRRGGGGAGDLRRRGRRLGAAAAAESPAARAPRGDFLACNLRRPALDVGWIDCSFLLESRCVALRLQI